jgi:hypothetical protein
VRPWSQRARWGRALGLALAAALALVLLAHPSAGASDVWGNVGPASPFGIAGLDGRYPLGNYALDEHFTAVSAGVFSGVDVSGVPPMIAYFLADVLWQLTAFLANCLISLFGFAFSLDLVNGSAATGGAGALAPVAAAIHSIYASVFGGPWLVLSVAVAGCWAMWKALVQRRYSETAGSLALSLLYITIALFFVAEPAQTIGAASKWTNEMSGAFLSIAKSGSPGGQQKAKQAGADQLFGLLVFQPWSVLEFGGTEHCVNPGTGSSGSDPVSMPVQPLPAEASRRLQAGEEVSSEGKLCIDNARKYSSHFLRFGSGSEERNQEYEALNAGDASKLPEADPSKASGTYKLGVADKPATDAMEEGGQYQRLLIAVVVFIAELGAFCLLGALSVGVILSQVLLLLLLAFSPVALVAAVIPGRGHEFFKGWLSKLAGFLLRKAAYSLVLAVLLAICAAISAATSQLGWLMSFGLQCLFFWAVFVQRKALTESLVGIATGPRAPGGEGALKVLALYYGARSSGRPLRRAGHSVGSAVHRTRRWRGGGEPRAESPLTSSGAPRGEEQRPHPVGGGGQAGEAPRPANHPPSVEGAGGAALSPGRRGERGDEQASGPRKRDTAKGSPRKRARWKGEAPSPKGDAAPKRPAEVTGSPRADDAPSTQRGGAESPLSAQLRAERERARAGAERRGTAGKPSPTPGERGGSQASDSRAPQPARKGPRVGKRGGRE